MKTEIKVVLPRGQGKPKLASETPEMRQQAWNRPLSSALRKMYLTVCQQSDNPSLLFTPPFPVVGLANECTQDHSSSISNKTCLWAMAPAGGCAKLVPFTDL